MQVCRFTTQSEPTPRLGVLQDDLVYEIGGDNEVVSLDRLLTMSASRLQELVTHVDTTRNQAHQRAECTLLAPIENQEVWACGVTYERSRDARMRESAQASAYDLVYDAERPEIFFKATPHRVVGPGQPIIIRSDSTWDVPEPELALVLNSALELVGFTIGNDVSSRSIEGENPLYLPQAKTYQGGCALGPAITPAWEVADPYALTISLTITRAGQIAFEGSIGTDRLHRTFDDLISYLGRDNTFPYGVFVLTGTGIVPPDEFTLQPDDRVQIAIDGLQLPPLENPVQRGLGQAHGA
jgi:2-dehydro-3-deoxy-D-arabinonate dehydratase